MMGMFGGENSNLRLKGGLAPGERKEVMGRMGLRGQTCLSKRAVRAQGGGVWVACLFSACHENEMYFPGCCLDSLPAVVRDGGLFIQPVSAAGVLLEGGGARGD